MGSGGGTSTQYVKSETSNLPSYVQPYFTDLLSSAKANTIGDPNGYQAYPGQRVAGFNEAQTQVQNDIRNQQTPGQFGAASQMGMAAGLGSLAAGQYDPSRFRAQQVGTPNLQSYSMGNPQVNGTPTLQNYGMEATQAGPTPQLQDYQMQGPGNVQGAQAQAPTAQAAQTDFGAGGLNYFNMQQPQSFGQQQADQYMSPYAQNVMDVQKREAVTDAKKGQLAEDLGAARQGTYGGSRQLLASMERERNLGNQLGDIQSKGQQAAYENAQAQFERDRAAGMDAGKANLNADLQTQQLGTQTGLQSALANLGNQQQTNLANQSTQYSANALNAQNAQQAALANQQMGFNTGQQNLNANLQTQQLGSGQQMQALLANQQAGLTAGQNNLNSNLQTQQLGSGQQMQALLANQQAGLTSGQQNLNAQLQTQQLGTQSGLQALLANQQQNLEAQRLSEQSKQFGANLGLQGAQGLNQSAQTMANIGQMQGQGDLARLNQQNTTAAQQQALQQQFYDTQYQDFLRQQQYPLDMLQQYNSILHGVPVTPSTQTTISQPTPSTASQILGTGLGALGMFNSLKG